VLRIADCGLRILIADSIRMNPHSAIRIPQLIRNPHSEIRNTSEVI